MAPHKDYGDTEESMQVTAFVEQLDEQTFRAETAQPIALATEGRTRDDQQLARAYQACSEALG